MADDRPEAPLGELVRNFDSKRVPLSSRERAKRKGSYPYYGATGVMDQVDAFLFEGLHLLVAEDGSVERPNGTPYLQLVSGRFWVNNHAHVLKGATDDDTRFLYYALSTVPIRPYMSGSVQDKLSQGNLNKILVPYPKEERVRRGVASVLGAFDDKIELNRRMSETLEAIVRALFRSWFVDFDPVRAKAGGRDRGPTLDLVGMFPDSLGTSELGEIPNGWRYVTISDIAALNDWTLRSTDELAFLDYIEISEVMRGEIRSVTRYVRGEEPSRARRRLKHGDTVLSTVRPDRGAFFLCINPPETLIASTGFAVVTPTNGTWAFVHAALTQPEVGEKLGRLADGGAYPALRPEAIGGLSVVVPDDVGIVEKFQSLAAPFYERAHVCRREAVTLGRLRDALLPRLIAGDLRVTSE